MPDAETCREYIISEEYMDFIANVRRSDTIDELLQREDVCSQYLGASFFGLYTQDADRSRQALNRYPYFSIPKCYTLLDTEAMYQAGIVQVQNYPGLELMGEGVLVGFVDTGIDYENPIFRNLDGSTRIVRIWDQTEQSGIPPEDFLYGSEYDQARINAALNDENPREIVPSEDTNGHGTFLISLACGSANPEERFIGAAPESEIAVVKLKEAKQYLRDFYFVDADAVCYQETDLMAGIHYLELLARRRNQPLVICVAVGSNMGGHNGLAPLGRYLQSLSTTTGIVIVAGGGNEADKRHHYLGQLAEESAEEEVEIRVGNNTRGFTMEIWNDIPDVLSVTIVSPGGERVGSVSGRYEDGFYDFVFDKTQLLVTTRLLVEGSRSELITLQFDRPSAGSWKVIVEAVQYGTGRFHAWLPVEEFLTGEVYFLRSNPDYTITEPGNTEGIITVAYYNGADNSIAISSGRGYTRSERIKPDFAAPGINVTGATLRGQFTARSGSSIAAGITAGAVALLLEWIEDKSYIGISSIQMESFLIFGTNRRSGTVYPNREWGYGTLDVYSTLETVRQY